ncbi:conserved hypothetical protein [Gammaproteobacteria bacterium]
MLFDAPHAISDIQFSSQPSAIAAQYERNQIQSLMLAAAKNRGASRAEINTALEWVDEFQAMPADWDGYGALAISGQTVSNAHAALEKLLVVAPVPDITPNPNGTISLEWESRYGVAHLEIGKTRFSLYIKPTVGKTTWVDGQVDQIRLDIGTHIVAILYPAHNSAETITTFQFTVGHARIAY